MPALPRTIVRLAAKGDHTTPTRGDRLLESVVDGLQPLQVVADAGIQRDARGELPLVLGVQREIRDSTCETSDVPNVCVKPALL